MAGSRRGSAHRGLARASAFTLVEMLIAMVLTLILVLAIAEFYAVIGDAVKDGRATIEMGGQLRAVVQRLKADLDQLTVSVAPWTDDGSASGYFEYYEGRGNDYEPFAHIALNMATGFAGLANNGVTNGLGDGDDFLAFTIRSAGQPFTGRQYDISTGTTHIINSQLAEVIWWVAFEDLNGNGVWDADEPRQLYRRQLLIRPDLLNIDSNTPHPNIQEAYKRLLRLWQLNDISLRIQADLASGSYKIVPNSLADLARRENRFGHMPMEITLSSTMPPYLIDSRFSHSATTLSPNFPLLMPSFTANSPGVAGGSQQTFVLTGPAMGEDLVLSNLLAFDVQAYDPYARLWPDNPGNLGASQAALTPSDPGYRTILENVGSSLNANVLLGLGAYVDLNYYRYVPASAGVDATLSQPPPMGSGIPMPHYGKGPDVPSSLTDEKAIAAYLNNLGYYNYPFGATYDTWSVSYERDGIDQLGTGRYDWQTNGVDDNGDYVVDDVGERETVPPYSQPLRGLRVRIRMYEPSTRQIRQATVETDFLRE